MIIIVDFGSQTTHLIGRRLKELGTNVKIVSPQDALSEINKIKPNGIILSGGPSSVYEKGAPTIDKKIFNLGIPILGICYGLQLTAHLLGGKVIKGRKEYGPVSIKLKIKNEKLKITEGLKNKFTVWMSHGDEVIELPNGFKTIGSTETVPFALAQDLKRNIIGLQFHPEVEHTEFGLQILSNFVEICNLKTASVVEGKFKVQSSKFKVEEIENSIKEMVGEKDYVIGAVSGGVDSTVAATLTAKAIGKRFIPIYVDNGLMREGTLEHVKRIFSQGNLIVVNAIGEMLKRLRRIVDPEQKRKIIGSFYIEIFEQEMKKLLAKKIPVKFLLQGTIYSDVIESQGTKHSAKIKSHHNVGGLPAQMKLKLLEPMRNFYKDEVRQIGSKLGLPDEFVWKQKFPGPGHAIRIRGEVTKERLEKVKQADVIVLEEIEKAGWMSKVFHSFPVMTGAYSTAVKGDGRFFGEVVALRVTISSDEMTCGWAHLPYEVLQKISSRIVNEIPGVSRVVYDITTKPPATMEWE